MFGIRAFAGARGTALAISRPRTIPPGAKVVFREEFVARWLAHACGNEDPIGGASVRDAKTPPRSAHGTAMAGPAPGVGWRLTPNARNQRCGARRGSCATPSQPVPELTRSVGIQLNERVWLRRTCEAIAFSQSRRIGGGCKSFGHAFLAIRGRRFSPRWRPRPALRRNRRRAGNCGNEPPGDRPGGRSMCGFRWLQHRQPISIRRVWKFQSIGHNRLAKILDKSGRLRGLYQPFVGSAHAAGSKERKRSTANDSDPPGGSPKCEAPPCYGLGFDQVRRDVCRLRYS
jgi:hypothetical protein